MSIAVCAPSAAPPRPGTCWKFEHFHTLRRDAQQQAEPHSGVSCSTSYVSRSKALGNPKAGINDFALKLANVNGTGSASANGLLMQAIFRMGILLVTGKNLFPSNIQGLPHLV